MSPRAGAPFRRRARLNRGPRINGSAGGCSGDADRGRCARDLLERTVGAHAVWIGSRRAAPPRAPPASGGSQPARCPKQKGRPSLRGCRRRLSARHLSSVSWTYPGPARPGRGVGAGCSAAPVFGAAVGSGVDESSPASAMARMLSQAASTPVPSASATGGRRCKGRVHFVRDSVGVVVPDWAVSTASARATAARCPSTGSLLASARPRAPSQNARIARPIATPARG